MNDLSKFVGGGDKPESMFSQKKAAQRATVPIGISLTHDSLDQIDFITEAMIENRKGEPNRTELMRFGLFAVSEMLSREELSPEILKLWDDYDANYRKKTKKKGINR